MEKDQVIELWKKLGVTSVEFSFSCGGDSMNETEITIYTKDGVIKNESISDHIDNEVYDEVEFYVNSDGVYQGEYGIVTIVLDTDGEEECLSYSKDSTEEWTETIDHYFDFKITPKEYEFFSNFIKSFDFDSDGSENWDYKVDFVLTDEMEILQQAIVSRLDQEILTEELETEEGSEYNDYFSAEIVEVHENHLKICASYNYRIEKHI